MRFNNAFMHDIVSQIRLVFKKHLLLFAENRSEQSIYPFLAKKKEALKQCEKMIFTQSMKENYKYFSLTKVLESFCEYAHELWNNKDPDVSTKNLKNKYLESDIQKIHIVELTKNTSEDEYKTLLKSWNRLNIIEIEDCFSLLNIAFCTRIISVIMPQHMELEEPILLQKVLASNNTDYNHLIFLELLENSQATILYHPTLDTPPRFVEKAVINNNMHVYISKDAILHYYELYTEKPNNKYQIRNVHFDLDQKSQLTVYHLTIVETILRTNLHVVLKNQDAKVNLSGLNILNGNTFVDNYTSVIHKYHTTYSNELYKNIILDKSTAIFNGRIYVHPQAYQINAFQENRNLLLSNQANMYTKPQLEIWNDDVKCSHGVTTAQLDTEQLFYLQARGITLKDAKKLLFKSFSEEFLLQIHQVNIQKKLHKLIKQKLDKL